MCRRPSRRCLHSRLGQTTGQFSLSFIHRDKKAHWFVSLRHLPGEDMSLRRGLCRSPDEYFGSRGCHPHTAYGKRMSLRAPIHAAGRAHRVGRTMSTSRSAECRLAVLRCVGGSSCDVSARRSAGCPRVVLRGVDVSFCGMSTSRSAECRLAVLRGVDVSFGKMST